ncbi:hypothetical protein ALQ25_200067 [Pseudomonas coronafaciens pv. atropurpurea]|nr:hypothetical protein ALQ25_200067 [Pseudomonas coronafaciens pv. atropurpurea]
MKHAVYMPHLSMTIKLNTRLHICVRWNMQSLGVEQQQGAIQQIRWTKQRLAWRLLQAHAPTVLILQHQVNSVVPGQSHSGHGPAFSPRKIVRQVQPVGFYRPGTLQLGLINASFIIKDQRSVAARQWQEINGARRALLATLAVGC